MKYVLSCALLFLATVVFAQQQGQPPPTTTPPYHTPPTFPEGRQRPLEQMPPDTKAPPRKPCPASGLNDRFSINSTQSRHFQSRTLTRELTMTQSC